VTDAELVARAVVDEDRGAFGELVRRHQSAVRHFLRHLTRGDAALADDLAQETFVQAWRGLARFRGDASFSTWLLGIARNHWRNARRSQREAGTLDDHAAAPELATPAATAQTDLRHDLARALAQLSADEQLALHLGYQQGLSHAEIATLLDWPLGTVKTHLARGKDQLRSLLATWNPST
jgi:RNA polymerase sigma-70 factor, ECF subfamily